MCVAQEEVFGTPPRPEEVGGQTAAAAAAAKGAAGWVLDTAVSMLDSTAMEAAGGVDLKMFDELVRIRIFCAILYKMHQFTKIGSGQT